MPLDKVLISHLEEQDVLEDGIEADIDSLINGLSIKEIMANTEEALLGIVAEVQQDLKDKYYPDSAKNGVELADTIEKDGDIQVPKSDDPTLNEDLIDGVDGESTN